MQKIKNLSVTPLGTVSTYCYEGKNCPGFLVEYGEEKILLDCGNGISRYLSFPDDFYHLSIIISHLHPDHYGELLSIAQTSYVFNRLGCLKDKIKVYIPDDDMDSSKCGDFQEIEQSRISFNYLFSLQKESYLEFIPYRQEDSFSFGDLKVVFSKNPHPITTYSVKLEVGKIKLVYSSDTGYKGNCLKEFARGANLLICESTFLRGQIRKGNNHLFAYEAGRIAKSANVDKLLLTHFWPSIDKQNYVNEARKVFPNTEAAEEGKKIILMESDSFME